MKLMTLRWLCICALWLGAQTFTQTASSTPNRTTDEEAIQKAESEMLSAYYHNDANGVSRVETSDFLVTHGEEISTKDQQLAAIRKYDTPFLGTYRAEQRQFRFLEDGNVAVLSEKFHKSADAKEPALDFRVSEVWVKKGNEWKMAYLHYQDLSDEQKNSAAAEGK